MMAEHIDAAYKRIEEAIATGKKVEHCSMNQDGGAEGWAKWMGSDVRRWHPSRYRIDGQEVWPNYVSEIGRGVSGEGGKE